MPDVWLFLFIGFLVLVFSVDAWRYYVTGQETLTRWIRRHQMLAFVLGLAIGIIAGHLWWCVCA